MSDQTKTPEPLVADNTEELNIMESPLTEEEIAQLQAASEDVMKQEVEAFATAPFIKTTMIVPNNQTGEERTLDFETRNSLFIGVAELGAEGANVVSNMAGAFGNNSTIALVAAAVNAIAKSLLSNNIPPFIVAQMITDGTGQGFDRAIDEWAQENNIDLSTFSLMPPFMGGAEGTAPTGEPTDNVVQFPGRQE